MKIDKIQSYITPKTTGYAAVASLSIALLSGQSKLKSVRKLHKPSAWTSVILTILHIGLIEYYHHKYKK